MLTEKHRSIFEGRNFAHVATLMPDGSPQVTPVWVELDGDDIIVNTAEGRIKTENVRRDPRIAVSVLDHENPYSMVAVRGVVTQVTQAGGEEGIDRLAKKYMGVDRYPAHDPDYPRVVLRISPTSVAEM